MEPKWRLIRFVVVASQKSRMYKVTLRFHYDTKEFLSTPCSSCECPAGSLMSHYSMPLMVWMMQSTNDAPYDVMKCLPPCITHLLALYISLEVLIHHSS